MKKKYRVTYILKRERQQVTEYIDIEAWNGGEAKYLAIEKVKERTGSHAFHAVAKLIRDEK